jgi:hypothetical protein
MGQPYSFIGSWTYTNAATPVAQNIPMTDKPDWVFVKDLKNWGAQNTAANPIYTEWFSSMAAGSYLALGQPSSTGSGVTTYASRGTSGGFTFINQASPPTYSKVAMTAVTGTTFVVSTASTTGINVGDFIRLINVVGALELTGFLYQVTAVSTDTSITLGYAATAETARGITYGSGTTGFYQKVYPGFMYPSNRTVMFISQATQAKVYFARQNDFTVGELVDFQIPTPYGMTQLSNLTGNSGSGPFASNPAGAARVLVVTNSASESSITIDVDTSGFTAFTYPASASYTSGDSPPVCIPAGSGVVPLNGSATIPASPPGTNLLDAFDNHSQYVMNIGTSAVGIASADMVVFAFKADFSNGITNA